jgi:hypothetical protein
MSYTIELKVKFIVDAPNKNDAENAVSDIIYDDTEVVLERLLETFLKGRINPIFVTASHDPDDEDLKDMSSLFVLLKN